jgi:hypothetical protein
MFWKKKSEAQKEFFKNYKKSQTDAQLMLMICINMYGFLKDAIDNNIINKLNKLLTVSEEIKDIIYYTTAMLVKTDAFDEYEGMSGLGCAATFILTGSLISTDKPESISEFKLDNNPNIAFDQMMAKLYSLQGKEYIDSDVIVRDIKKEYLAIIFCCANGMITGMKKMGVDLVYSKMKNIIDISSDGVVKHFDLTLKMIPFFKKTFGESKPAT